MLEPTQRREELLDRIVDVLLADGIAEVSLRPLSAAVGSSARLLIYHFGSKEELIAVALERVRARITKAVGELVSSGTFSSLDQFFRVFWTWATQEPNQRYFRLLFEIDGLAMHEGKIVSDKDRVSGATGWLKMFAKSAEKLADTAQAQSGASTVIVAAINGLLHDFFATGDVTRTTAGVDFLIEVLANQAESQQRKKGSSGQ